MKNAKDIEKPGVFSRDPQLKLFLVITIDAVQRLTQGRLFFGGRVFLSMQVWQLQEVGSFVRISREELLSFGEFHVNSDCVDGAHVASDNLQKVASMLNRTKGPKGRRRPRGIKTLDAEAALLTGKDNKKDWTR